MTMRPEVQARLSLIRERRSIRCFLRRDVADEQIQTLLEAAMAAPSAVAKDPWRFVIVRTAEGRAALAGELSNGEMLNAAALGIVVCGDLEAAHDRQLSYLLQDCAAAIENLLLAVHALGLGACWLGIHPREKRIVFVKNLLRLPESVIPVACIAIGHPDERKPARTRFDAAYVHHEKW